MAVIELSQASVPAASPGTRLDLIPREVIVATCTSPAPGAGVSYTWEITDRVGTTGTITSGAGTAVINIGPASSIGTYTAFKLKLTADDNGIITESTIEASVSHPLGKAAQYGQTSDVEAEKYLAPPLFAETADPLQTLTVNDSTTSTDDFSRELADTGITAANWRGWSSKDYDIKKRLMDKAFHLGWEIDIQREDGDGDPDDVQIFVARLNEVHRYMPEAMWGLSMVFDLELTGYNDNGDMISADARVRYNVLRAWNQENSGPTTQPGVEITYTEYNMPATTAGTEDPESVLSPESPTGPNMLYIPNAEKPDGPIYFLPALFRLAPSDWAIALILVMASPDAAGGEDINKFRLRIKPVLSSPDTVGYVDPDYVVP